MKLCFNVVKTCETEFHVLYVPKRSLGTRTNAEGAEKKMIPVFLKKTGICPMRENVAEMAILTMYTDCSNLGHEHHLG